MQYAGMVVILKKETVDLLSDFGTNDTFSPYYYKEESIVDS